MATIKLLRRSGSGGGRRCQVCTHPKAKEIDRELVTDAVPYQQLATKYGVNISSLWQHAQKHIPMQLIRSKLAREASDGDRLFLLTEDLRIRAMEILELSVANKDLSTAPRAMREARSSIELMARLQGQIRDEVNVNIVMSPAWMELQAVILKALEPYPEAKQAVAKALNPGTVNGQYKLIN